MERYCRDCEKQTSHRRKGLRSPVDVCNECDSTNSTYTLIKNNGEMYDTSFNYGEMHRAEQVKFVEWEGEELGSRGKKLHDFPKAGFSVLLDPQYGPSFTWLTTPIAEIVELKEEYLKFTTQNSSYELFGPINLYEEPEGNPV